jgi:hypothetical protein
MTVKSGQAGKGSSGSRAWLRIAAWIGGVLVAIALCCVLGGWLWFRSFRARWTSDTPAELPAVEVTASDRRRLEPVYERVHRSLSGKSRGETSVTLDSDDVNKLLASLPESRNYRDKVRFHLSDDKVVATVNVSLHNVPQFSGRYLQGEFTFEAGVLNGELDLRLLGGRIKGMSVPDWMLSRLNESVVEGEVKRRFSSLEWRGRLKSVEVKDSLLTLVTTGG